MKHWLRAFKFLVWLGTSRGYPIRFTHSFRSPPSFSLRPLPMTRNRRSLGIHHLSFALPGRSILLHFSRDRFFSPPWSCCTRLLLPRPLSFSLGKVSLLSLFFTLLSSSVIRPSRGSRRPVSSSPLLQLSSIFRDVFSPPRGGGNARENHSSRIALRKMFAFFSQS